MKRFRRSTRLVLALLLCCALTACGSGAKLAYDAPQAAGFYAADEDYAAAENEAVKSGGTDAGNGAGSVYGQRDVKLIRRAWLEVQSTQFDADLASLVALTEQVGGYFERSDLYTGGYYAAAEDCRTGEYVVRVPADQYDRFMNGLDGVGTITRRSENTEDVGQAYYDLESRLKTQRIKQERLQDLLARADKMEDVIALENALSEVEYMIEDLSSGLRRYDGLIDFATITVSLREVVRVNAAPGERESLLKRMGAGVVSSVHGLLYGLREVCVWVAYHLVGLIFCAAVTVGLILFIKRMIRRVKGAKVSEQNENTQN